ncbi:MAG TPA: hypothetical protein VMV10_28545 [Pirellulales bacterium]|nr:hypothetical protein [Pirellulales bacterium]
MNGPLAVETAVNKLEVARKHLVMAYARWTLYREIYRSGKDNIDVLNAVTGLGWGMIHDLLIDSIILDITRLLDKDGRTLSLRRIISDLDDEKTAKLLNKSLDDVADAVKILKIHRDKRVAHFNQEIALDARKLPSLDAKMFEDGLKRLGDLMNKLAEHLGADCYDGYEPVTDPTGTSIVVYLRCGLQAAELGKKAVLGEISKEELFEEVAKLA